MKGELNFKNVCFSNIWRWKNPIDTGYETPECVFLTWSTGEKVDHSLRQRAAFWIKGSKRSTLVALRSLEII